MLPSNLFFRLFTFLLPPAIIGTAYLYLYPVFQQCGFPEARHAEAACYFGDQVKHGIPGETAPFRLLALADPQLEGDTSIPTANEAEWWQLREFPQLIRKYRKKLDLWGNDLYLAHVYRTMRWFTDPTHVVVLGDLLGSQWIPDEEFHRRSDRFWNTVFRGGVKVPNDVTQSTMTKAGVLGQDDRWKNRIIAVAGNHDIGYAGDLDEKRVERFEYRFGRVNWHITFALNDSSTRQMGGRLGGSNAMVAESPQLRLMVLNSMNLDEPVKSENLQVDSRSFLSDRLFLDLPHEKTGTIVLTHVPLHKETGICADGPFVDYFPQELGGGIKEQNHLSYEMSNVVLDGVIGPELYRKGIVLNGHDHVGCQTFHYKHNEIDVEAVGDEDEDRWVAKRYQDAALEARNASLAGVREVTVRSMMGQYGGNAGLLSAWWDRETEEWKFDYATCSCGIQHIWWAVHALDLVVIGTGLLAVLLAVFEVRTEDKAAREAQRLKKTS